jgi:glutamate dehydrogenase/leucine dehydrogenase
MAKAGLELVSSGANVPFADAAIFYGETAEQADRAVACIPDFIANCGMARVFAYLMSDEEVDMRDAAIFADTSETIRRALEEVHAVHPGRTGLTAAAYRVALDRLGVRA